MSHPLIQLVNVHKRFGDVQVLKGVNLSIHQGEITAVIGKSGTGKSVLLKHIIGLIRPDTGQIKVRGIPLDQISKSRKSEYRSQISYMFQDNALFDFLTVYENIALPLAEKALAPPRRIAEKVAEKMQQLGLEGTEVKYPSQLSGGMRKRVALARALVTDPKAVLFDEPTTGLDPVRKSKVHEMITEYQKHFGFTAVIVSHDIPDIFDIAQHIAMLDKGRIVIQGSRDKIMGSEMMAAFIRGEDIAAPINK